jgi:hypothetical protein
MELLGQHGANANTELDQVRGGRDVKSKSAGVKFCRRNRNVFNPGQGERAGNLAW